MVGGEAYLEDVGHGRGHGAQMREHRPVSCFGLLLRYLFLFLGPQGREHLFYHVPHDGPTPLKQ